jgi:Ca2+-binding EF-hand superfamily protein
MTAFFAASVYLSLSVDKVTNGGVFKLSAENATNTSDAKVNQLSKKLRSDSDWVNFKEFMTTISVPNTEQTNNKRNYKLYTLVLNGRLTTI